jgi:hypothetical protein
MREVYGFQKERSFARMARAADHRGMFPSLLHADIALERARLAPRGPADHRRVRRAPAPLVARRHQT